MWGPGFGDGIGIGSSGLAAGDACAFGYRCMFCASNLSLSLCACVLMLHRTEYITANSSLMVCCVSL